MRVRDGQSGLARQASAALQTRGLYDAVREAAIVAGSGEILKVDMSFGQLDKTALKMSDTECARKMGAAKAELLRRCKIESPQLPRTF